MNCRDVCVYRLYSGNGSCGGELGPGEKDQKHNDDGGRDKTHKLGTANGISWMEVVGRSTGVTYETRGSPLDVWVGGWELVVYDLSMAFRRLVPI